MKNKFLIQLTLILLMPPAMAQTIIPLYSDVIPNSKSAPNEELTKQSHGLVLISKVSIPTLSIYLPPKEKSNGTAVIICPGGGYNVIATSHEGSDVAKKFNELGVAAFVLKYRIPNHATMQRKDIGPLQDAQQAIKIVRERAKEWGVNPNKVGIVGFSAGGHLASTAGTHFDHAIIPNEKKTSVRPDFMILIYPVISFQDSIGHIGSRNKLIGKQPTTDKINYYSNELRVTPRTPPTFLVHALNDLAVKSENSVLFHKALLKNNVSTEIHLYEKGGHGFGLLNEPANDPWIEKCKIWMKNNGWL
jgi:acetyl esterase/lipase